MDKSPDETRLGETIYPPPVDGLLAYADCRTLPEWPNYLRLGLGPQHVDDLIRMATDMALREGDPEGREVWAPVHAWRALAQLRAEAAVEPLITLLRRIDEKDDDWALDELPTVFTMIGPAAVPALDDYLARSAHGPWARMAAAAALAKIGTMHGEARGECVAALVRGLERFPEHEDSLNAALVTALVDLNAVEVAPLMQRVFEAKCVDVLFFGNWEDVQISLGLKSPVEAAKPYMTLPPGEEQRFVLAPRDSDAEKYPAQMAHVREAQARAREKAKARRKQARKARKRRRR